MRVAGLVVLLYFGSEEISPGLEYLLHKKQHSLELNNGLVFSIQHATPLRCEGPP